MIYRRYTMLSMIHALFPMKIMQQKPKDVMPEGGANSEPTFYL
jgi:hypothetical protein